MVRKKVLRVFVTYGIICVEVWRQLYDDARRIQALQF